MLIKINRYKFWLYIIFFIIFYPNYFYTNNAFNRRLFTSSMLFVFIIFTFVYLNKNKSKYIISYKNFPLLILINYILLNIYLNQTIIYGNTIFRDTAEITRVIGIVFFYYLGYILPDKIDLKTFKKIIFFISFIYAIFIAGYYINISFINNILKLFYTNKFHRFFGTWGSVNYIWIVPLTIFISLLILIESNQINFYKLKDSFFIVFNITTVVSTLILSGSRTSIIVFISIVLLFSLLKLNLLKKRNIKYLFILLIVLLIIYLLYKYLNFSNIIFQRIFSLFEIDKINELKNINSIKLRLQLWKEIWNNKIINRLLIGYGSSKAGITITDNSYLMSIYRYGIIGLFLEIYLYIFLLLRYIKYYLKINSEVKYLYYLPIFLMIGYLISCIPANSFYELKTPYYLFFIFGFFNNNKYLKKHI